MCKKHFTMKKKIYIDILLVMAAIKISRRLSGI